MSSCRATNGNAYTPCWERRPPGKEVKKQPPKPEGTLSSKDLKKLLEAVVQASLDDPRSELSRAIDADGHLNSRELAAEKTSWHRASMWGRDSKKKGADGTVVRVFSTGIYAATVTSDTDDMKILDVTVQVGPAWDVKPSPVKLTLP